jgi:hypothetical protein
MKKKQGFLWRVDRYRERGARARVKTAHASILRAIKGIPGERERERERKSPFPSMDLLLVLPFLSIWKKSSSSRSGGKKRTGIDGRVRDEGERKVLAAPTPDGIQQ